MLPVFALSAELPSPASLPFGGFCFEHLPEVVLGCSPWQLFNLSRNHSAEHPSDLINHSLLGASIPFYCVVPAAPKPLLSSNFQE